RALLFEGDQRCIDILNLNNCNLQDCGRNDANAYICTFERGEKSAVVLGCSVSWSNERPLENKELKAIIGAWFTLWRD
ncbi:hypothetical protein Tco_1073578, partial [Tanacetum coccineum]